MSGTTQIWDYLLAAADGYAGQLRRAQQTASDEPPLAEPIVFWLNRAASDTAHDFAKMIEMGVPPQVAQMAIQLSADTMVALSAAHEILGRNYEEWQKTGSSGVPFESAFV